MAIADFIFLRRALQQFASARQHLHAHHSAPGLAAVAAGIHRQHAAQCAGDADEEFGAAQMVRRGKARQLGARHAGLRVDQVALPAQLGQPPEQQQYRAAKSAVAHQQVAAETHRQHGLVSGCLAQERLQISQVCRLIHTVCNTAGTPADVTRHGLVAKHLSAQPFWPELCRFAHIHFCVSCFN